jgi:molybdopterin synthase sulfur carrier subunit
VIDEQDAIRPHIKIFVNRMQASSIGAHLTPDDEVLVVAALSGG